MTSSSTFPIAPKAPPSVGSYATVAIRTHGCKLNQADSELLGRYFTEAGYRVVDWTAGADVMVLDTCTVTATADAKARQALRAAHRANRGAVIVATGCYAQRAAERLAGLEGVSLVVGNSKKDQLVASVTAILAERTGKLNALAANSTTQARTGFRESLPEDSLQQSAAGRSRSMIKIQEGCDQVCAYCIVPKVRGRERSVPQETILSEINHRVGLGCQEVVLTGTQLGTYGHDLPGGSLVSLLKGILEGSSVPRVRVSSLQAQEISTELLELWANPRLCPHFHVPLQSGSDRILRSMRRRYDTGQFARTVEVIRRMWPDAGITTDVIVGFPGEDSPEYQESQQFAASMRFSGMHVFPFSPRPGTSADYLGDSVPAQVKKERAAEMAQVATDGFLAFRTQQLGHTRPVLWESARNSGTVLVWSGLTDNYIRVSTQDQRNLHNMVAEAQLLELAEDQVISKVA